MGKGMWVIEVEGIDHLVILKIWKAPHRLSAVPVCSPDDDIMNLIYLTDLFEQPADDPVPHVNIDTVRLIHKLKYKIFRSVLISLGQLCPYGCKYILDICRRHRIHMRIVMEIKYHIYAQLF